MSFLTTFCLIERYDGTMYLDSVKTLGKVMKIARGYETSYLPGWSDMIVRQ